MICQELLAGRIYGPFLTPPPGLIISPLGAVPKKDTGKVRIIHNLSYPIEDSVDSNIPREFCAVEYELIDVLINLVATIGEWCLMSKGDLFQAFRVIRVSVNHIRLLGLPGMG